uniref:Uncharacterized protein n=1 Tax=Aegilops tauschii subsp. strangulata TaxID=200361 RepID=A0A453GXE4_AEGTS
ECIIFQIMLRELMKSKGNSLMAIEVVEEERFEDAPYGAGSCSTGIVPIPGSFVCGSPAPASSEIDGELVCARGRGDCLNEPRLGPAAVLAPLISGWVVHAKAASKNTRLRLGNSDEEEVADFYGQLWVVPSPRRHPRPHIPHHQPPNPKFAIPKLFWVRKDMFQSKSFTIEDCFPVPHPGLDPTPTKFQITVPGFLLGSRSFAEVVRDMENQGQGNRNCRPPAAKKAAPTQEGRSAGPPQVIPVQHGGNKTGGGGK